MSKSNNGANDLNTSANHASGQQDPTWQGLQPLEARLMLSATLEGTVYADRDADGTSDANEGGLQNWVVYIDANSNRTLDTGEAQATTDADGAFTITGIAAGVHDVVVLQPADWRATGAGAVRRLNFVDGQTQNLEVGERPKVTISGPREIGEGQNYTLSLNTGSLTPTSWDVDWGDGSSTTRIGAQLTASHTYAASATGQYEIKVSTSIGGHIFDVNVPDGLLDPTFSQDGKASVALPAVSGTEGDVVVVQPDGKVLVAGGSGFTVARFNADGTLDTGFGTGGTFSVYPNSAQTGWLGPTRTQSILVQLDGKIVLVGSWMQAAAIRLTPAGILDTTFGNDSAYPGYFKYPDGSSTYTSAFDAVLEPGTDKIILVGSNNPPGAPGGDLHVRRLTADGDLDTSYATNGLGHIPSSGSEVYQPYSAIRLSDGSIVVAGRAWSNPYSPASSTKLMLAKFDASGSAVAAFGSNGVRTTDVTANIYDEAATDLVVVDGNKFVVAGYVGNAGGTDFVLARYDQNGQLDTAFGVQGVVLTDIGASDDRANAITVLPDGKLLVTGRSNSNFVMARYGSDGQLDTTFGDGGYVATDIGSDDVAEGVVFTPDGKIYLGGISGGTLAVARYGIATGDGLTVTVVNGAPVLTPLTPPPVVANAQFGVDLATFTDGGVGNGTHTALIDWGDGTQSEGVIVRRAGSGPAVYTVHGKHEYAAVGTYTVEVTVEDAAGASDSVEVTLVASVTEAYYVPGDAGELTDVTFTIQNFNAEASYRNELGMFIVDGINGRIGNLLPGQPGYAEAALTDDRTRVVFQRDAVEGTTFTATLAAGTYIAFYLIQDNTTAQFLATNPANAMSRRTNAFFLHPQANPDNRFQHFRKVADPNGGTVYSVEDLDYGGDQDFNDFIFSINGAPTGNRAPIITSNPATSHSLPPTGHPATGAVTPQVINLELAPGATSEHEVSVSVPVLPSDVPAVDVFLLFDDTGSFEQVSDTVKSEFPRIIAQLRQAYPGVSFGFGVGRFEDYHGADSAFTLNQPIITPDQEGFDAAISGALSRNAPGNGGDGPESLIEALYQVATGAGFDGNGDGDTTDSGPAGLEVTQTSPPGSDIPAFGSFVADPAKGILKPAGSIGGAGFRKGALPIILAATDIGTVYEPESPAIGSVVGKGGVQIPFEEFARGDGASRGSTVGGRGAQIQNTVNALNQIDARVIGLGAEFDEFAFDYDGDGTEDHPYDAADYDPRRVLSALARATGMVSQLPTQLDSGVAGDPIEAGDPFYYKINPNSAPSISRGITSAINAAVANELFDVDVVTSDPTVQVDIVGSNAEDIANGQTATFKLRFTGTGLPEGFDLIFVKKSTGVAFGTIPVKLTTPYVHQLTATDPDNDTPLTFSFVEVEDLPNSRKPVGAQLVNGSTIKWQPTEPGRFHFRVEVSDGHGGVGIKDWHVVVGAEGSDSPQITSTPPPQAVVNQQLTYQVVAQDAGETLKYYLHDAPHGMTINRGSGMISWTPGAKQIGQHNATVVVTDEAGGRAEQALPILVKKEAVPNRLPQVLSTDPKTAVVGRLYGYNPFVSDADDDVITFEPVNLPAGMTLQAIGGSITWIPQQTGTYPVTFNVRDSQGAVVKHTYNIEVLPAPLTPPIGLSATAVAADTIDLNWADHAAVTLKEYRVYRATSKDGPYAHIGVADDSHWTDNEGISAGTTYFYRITAVHNRDIESDPSEVAEATSGPDAAPATPINGLASGNGEAITLTWSANTESDLDGYIVKRLNTSSGTWEAIHSGVWRQTSIRDAGAPINQASQYQLFAVDRAGNESLPSAPISGMRSDASAPSEPTGLRLSYTDAPPLALVLAWNPNPEPDLAGYLVKLKTGSGSQVLLTSQPITDTKFVIADFPVMIQAEYQVIAVDRSGNESTVAKYSDFRAVIYPSYAPQNVTAQGRADGNALAWSPVLLEYPDFVGYNVYWSSTGTHGTFTNRLTTTPIREPEYVDTGAPTNVARYYQVSAVSATNIELFSVIKLATRTSTDSVAPARPTGLKAFGSPESIRLEWQPNTESDLAKYTVTRIDLSDNSTLDLTQGQTLTATECVDVTAVFGVSYRYEVRAVDTSGNASAAAPVEKKKPAAVEPTAPQGLTATVLGPNAIELHWNAHEGAEFRVYSVGGDGSLALLAQLAENRYRHAGLAAGSTHTYVVTAVVADDESAVSDAVTAKTANGVAPAAPAAVVAAGLSASQVRVSWSTSTTRGVKYHVYRDTAPTGTFSRVVTAEPVDVATIFDRSDLDPGTTYYYRVKAIDADGDFSAFSPTASAQTLPLSGDNEAPDAVKDLASLASNRGVTLTWSANTEGDLAGYVVARSLAQGGPYSQIHLGLLSPTTTEALDAGAPSGVDLYYRIIAVDTSDNQSEPRTVSAFRGSNDLEAPAAVDVFDGRHWRGIPAGGTQPTIGVNLRWTPTSDTDLYGYEITRYNPGSGTWDKVHDGYINPASPLVQGKLEWFDADAAFDGVTSYQYRIVAVDEAQNASSLTPTTVTKDTLAPTPPQDVAATSWAEAIQITWDDQPSADDDWAGWNIYRRNPANGEWVKLNTEGLVSETTGYNDRTAPVGAVSEYRVTSVDIVGNESAPVYVSKKRSVQNEPPKPTVTGKPDGAGKIRLSWPPYVLPSNYFYPKDNAVGYKVQRFNAQTQQWDALNGGNLVTAGTFVDEGLSPLTAYQYRVVTVDGDGDESTPGEVTVGTGDGQAPPAPAIIRAEALGERSIQIEWSASTGATKYEIYRSKIQNALGVLLTPTGIIAGNDLAFTDERLSPSTTYYYTVRALDADGDCADSVADVATKAAAAAPPYVDLISGGGEIGVDTEVRGIVDDPNNNLKSWKLVLRPKVAGAGSSEYVIAQGTTEQGTAEDEDVVLGTIKPAAIPDGRYQLVLIAEDATPGHAAVESQAIDVQIKTDIKLGNLTLPVTDLTVPSATGAPLTIQRVYDSSRADENGGDFGYGWRWDIQDAQLTSTEEPNHLYGIGPDPLREGDLVYVTLPGGGRLTFAFTPFLSNPHVPDGYKPRFTAVDGSGAELVVKQTYLDPDLGEFDIRLQKKVDTGGQFFMNTLDGQFGYNPRRSTFGGGYTVRTADATLFTVDSAGQITTITDSNGNTTAVSSSGVSSGGSGITLVRDPQNNNRIKAAVDPAGQKVRYAYDPQTGDLIGVVDRAKLNNQFLQTTYAYEGRLVLPSSASEAYAIVRNPTTGEVWNGQTGAFETWNDSNVANYAIALEREALEDDLDADGAADDFVASWHVGAIPSDLPAGTLDISYYTGVVSAAATAVMTESRAVSPNRPHLLVAVIDPRGVRTLAAEYDAQTRELTKLEDASGAAAPVDNGGLIATPEGVQTRRTVTDAVGTKTEIVLDRAIHDEYNRTDTTREIKEVRDAQGALIKYVVTVRSESYGAVEDKADVFEWQKTVHPNVLMSSVEYQSFEVVGPDAAGERYTKQPQQWLRKLVYNTTPGSADFKQLHKEIRPGLTANDPELVTTYADYRLGKPGKVTDPSNKTTTFEYDSATGNLEASVTPDGQRTEYTYTSGSSTGGNGLLKEVFVIRDDAPVRQQLNTYDANNRLASTTDASDVTRYFLYDNLGNLVVTYHHWDEPDADGVGDGNAEKTIVSRTSYDAVGRAIGSSQYILTGELEFTSASQLDSQTPQWTTSTRYNAVGQVDQTIDRYGLISETRYDIRGNAVETRTQTKHPTLGLVWLVSRTAYDTNGRAIASTDPFLVGNDGVQITPAADIRVNHSIYDSLGRVKESTRLAGVAITLGTEAGHADIYTTSFDTGYGSAAVVSSSSTEYDAAGRVSSTTNADGVTSYSEYDAVGRQIASISPAEFDGNGNVTAYHRTEYVYDALGRQKVVKTNIRQTGLGASATIDRANAQESELEYDDLGRQVATISAWVKDPDNPSQQVRLRTEYGYDALGRRNVVRENLKQLVATVTDAGDAAQVDRSAVRETVNTYDGDGRLTGVALPEIPDPANPSTLVAPEYTYGYDQYGNQISITDPNQNTTRFAFDHLGRQVNRTLPLGVQSTGNPSDFVEAMRYSDAALAGLATPGASAALGQLSVQIDFEGRVTQFLYDNTAGGNGRLVEKRYFTSETNFNNGVVAERVTYEYDAFGRTTRVVQDRDGVLSSTADQTVTTYEYDADGRVTAKGTKQGNGTTRYVRHEYDRLGRMTRTYTGADDAAQTSAASDGKAITDTRYAYDKLGRLSKVSVYERNDTPLASGSREHTSYKYDLVGNLDAVEGSNGVIADYRYDALNRLERLVHFGDDVNGDKRFDDGVDSEVMARFDYLLNLDGSRRGVLETDDAGDETEITWEYDALGRLVEEHHDRGADDAGAGDYVANYEMDLVGNRLEKRTDRFDGDSNLDGNSDETITYDYDDNDRLLTEHVDSGGEGTFDQTIVYWYGLGSSGVNTLTDQTTKTTYNSATASGVPANQTWMEYNLQGHVSKVTQNVWSGGGYAPSSVTHTRYLYDDSGIRISSEELNGSGTVTSNATFLIDANNHTGYAQVLEEWVDADGAGSGGTVLSKTYTLGHDVIAQQSPAQASGATLTLLYDGHGSTRAVMNGSAAVLERYGYDAYGNLLAGGGLTATNTLTSLLYSGEQFDTKTQLQYLRARYYSPSAGRFSSLDPFAGRPLDPQSLHKYVYGHANPITFTDPSGKVSYAELLIYTGIALTVASFSFNIGNSIYHRSTGNHAAANQALAWAMLDAVSLLTLPFIGPGAGLARIAGFAGSSIPMLSVAGVQRAALWGYITSVAHAFAASAGSGGASSAPGNYESTEGPGEWRSNAETLEEAAAAFQEKVTGKPRGWIYWLDGKKFDGYFHSTGELVDAKMDGWATLVGHADDFWSQKSVEFLADVRNMIQIASKHNKSLTIQMETAEKAQVMRNYLSENNVPLGPGGVTVKP